MWPRFGIKIGNSTFCIAAVKSDGKVEVIANHQGSRVSEACLLCEGKEIECGLTAKQKMSSKGAASVSANFQYLLPDELLTPAKLATFAKHISCKFDENSKVFELVSNLSDTVTETKISPFNVCVELFKAELALARCQFEEDFSPSVVLSIPHYYPHESWTILANAAEKAGFHVAQVITEPTAAVLACSKSERANDTEYVLCIKSGGLLTSLTLFEVNMGLYSVLGSIGPFYIGGKQFTDAIIDFIVQEFYKKYRLDPNESRRSLAKIRISAENCKHILTALSSTQVYIDSLMDGVDFNLHISRVRYEMLIQPVLNEFSKIINDAKATFAKKIPTDCKINQIVVCGGTMKIPALRDLISNSFSEAVLNANYSPDEVVAIGCATQATYLFDPSGKDLLETLNCKCITDDIYIYHGNDPKQELLLLSKGTILPACVQLNVLPVCSAMSTEESQDDSKENLDSKKDVIFKIRIGDEITEIVVKNAKISNGNYRIEANVELNTDDDNVLSAADDENKPNLISDKPRIAIQCL